MKILSFLFSMIVFAMTFLCALSMANEEKKHICYRMIDSDKDGKVTFQEFKKYFGDDIEKFKAIDLNSNGTLSHDEYHKSIGHGS